YHKHPEWRGTGRGGGAAPRLSYAYPGVRRVGISFLLEIASYPVDGVCPADNPPPPPLGYGAPAAAAFPKKYGLDPRTLDEKDPRWLAHRATVLTQFMREARSAMKETAGEQKRAKPPSITAIVMSSEAENLYFGMDLKAWIEGLVDTIVPYAS